MHVKGSPKISIFRMVCDAFAGKSKRAIAKYMDGVSAPLTYATGGHQMVHEYAGCQFSDSSGYGFKFGDCGRGRSGGVAVPGERKFVFISGIDNGKGPSVVLPASGRQAVKRGKTPTGNRHPGGRRVRGSTAKHSSKWKTVPVAYTAKCGYAHTAFPDGKVECVANTCYGAKPIPGDTRPQTWLDLSSFVGIEQW